jgi:hypothetical protein
MGVRRMIMLPFEAVRRQAYQISANNRYDPLRATTFSQYSAEYWY